MPAADLDGAAEQALSLLRQAGLPERLILDPSDPLVSAQKFIGQRYTHRSNRLLHHHRGIFYRYAGSHYLGMEPAALRSEVYAYLSTAMRRRENPGTGAHQIVPFKPNLTKVNQFLDALAAEAHLGNEYAAPSWLEQTPDLPPNELVPLANGLLHLPTGDLIPHNPLFFINYALPFAYEPHAPEPAGFLKFLDSIWGDDPEAISTLQEEFGYLLSGERRFQKIFLHIGPKRSGKGTLGRIIRAMMGSTNVAGPTLTSLATNFGLAPLIGKPIAIISDARLSGRVDGHVIAERLLSVSGEDALDIDRKYQDAWTGTLPTRFIIMTNELPRIADASGALASRFVILTMRRSFLDHEDHGLAERLLLELPAIFNWSLVGWRRLVQRGRFIEPASSAQAAEAVEALSSPILDFVRAVCVVELNASVPCHTLYERWCRWCEAQGRNDPGTVQSFGRDLRAAVPGLEVRQPRTTEGRLRVYAGVKLRDDGE